jgi:hypothetical protein
MRRTLVVCLLILAQSGCVLPWRRRSLAKYARMVPYRRKSTVKVHDVKVFKHPVRTDEIYDLGDYSYCLVLHPDQRDTVFRVWLRHAPQDMLDALLRDEVRQAVLYRRSESKPLREACWLYCEELNLGALICRPGPDRLIVEKRY